MRMSCLTSSLLSLQIIYQSDNEYFSLTFHLTGAVPYEGMSPTEVVENLRAGYRLPKPEGLENNT